MSAYSAEMIIKIYTLNTPFQMYRWTICDWQKPNLSRFPLSLSSLRIKRRVIFFFLSWAHEPCTWRQYIPVSFVARFRQITMGFDLSRYVEGTSRMYFYNEKDSGFSASFSLSCCVEWRAGVGTSLLDCVLTIEDQQEIMP